MLCSCGSIISEDASNHSRHLKSKRHLRGGLLSYKCEPCGQSFNQKINYTQHCACKMHKAKKGLRPPWNEFLVDLTSIVESNLTHRGMCNMKGKVLNAYFKRNSAFMVSTQSDTIHVYEGGWKEISVHKFMQEVDIIVTDALESALKRCAVHEKYVEGILENGHTKNGYVSKNHTFWCKERLVDVYKKLTKSVAKPVVQEPEPEPAELEPVE